MTEARAKAIAIINSDNRPATPSEAATIVNDLKNQGQFDVAEALCRRVRQQRPQPLTGQSSDARKWRKLRQRQALCTYKDYNRRRIEACEAALAVLDSDPQDETLGTSTDQETLGLAGAIWKRRWEVEGAITDLEKSAHYYLRGWECRDPEKDDGYTGINAAFVLDCLAAALDTVKLPGLGSRGTGPRDLARQIRGDVLAAYEEKRQACTGDCRPPFSWWEVATAAEAALGLGRFDDARTWLELAKSVPRPDWEWESTVRQLAALARHVNGAEAVVKAFAGDDAPGLFEGPDGKLGLALSGGGFRASIFHLGVLAALAEADLLRHVQVLSCVSGGSVTGAALYLHLLNLFNAHGDALEPQHYVNMVRALIGDLRAAVTGSDIRTDAFRGLLRLRHPTRQVGRLLEERLFRRIRPEGSLALRDLLYQPGAFHPRRDNWKRRAKLPELVINATTVNTGHTWQYTARSMGEAPFALEPAIDTEERLRRLNHDEAPFDEGNTSLGEAVAASASVPLFFPSLARKRLYRNRVVRLTDGGVTDNQGTFSLDEQDCTLMIVSDASGPFKAKARPWFTAMLPLDQVSNIMMNAIRRYQYRILKAQQRSGRIRNLLFLHLTEGLDMAPVDWFNAQWRKSETAAKEESALTTYGMPKDIQRALSRIRTDLDRFHPDAFDALAHSGYRMARHAIDRAGLGPKRHAVPWSFLDIAKRWQDTAPKPERQALLRRLQRGADRFRRGDG